MNALQERPSYSHTFISHIIYFAHEIGLPKRKLCPGFFLFYFFQYLDWMQEIFEHLTYKCSSLVLNISKNRPEKSLYLPP